MTDLTWEGMSGEMEVSTVVTSSIGAQEFTYSGNDRSKEESENSLGQHGECGGMFERG